MPKDWGDKPRNPSPEPQGARKSRWNTILFLRKEIKEKYGKKPRNPSWNKKGGGNHDGAECHNIRETSPTGQNARRLGKQPLEPYPRNEDETECQKPRERIPGTLPKTKRIKEMMMEQNARIPTTKKSRWNKPVS